MFAPCPPPTFQTHLQETPNPNLPPRGQNEDQREKLGPNNCSIRVFIPNYISKVKVQLVNCSTKNKSSNTCPVVLKMRARAPPEQLQSSSSMNMPQSFGTAMGFSLSDTLLMAALPSLSQNASHLHTSEDSIIYLAPTADMNKCWPIRPTLRNELDTFSVHFYVFFGPNISIPPDRAAVFAINLMPVLDSGGVLNMELKLNLVSYKIRHFTLLNC
ncbi:hypothetical protein XENOCAPTIV_001850 [Xenoophorus captivus]|uniref:Uncharacterized protein n=1 Tax=Xenoophorus captivus TaxID=1517983 RepID=A0ABV0QCK0_9TELE